MTFYPAPLPVPAALRTAEFLLQPLQPIHVELDFAAITSSRDMLRRWSNTPWVQDDFTLAENYRDLARHDSEHQRRESFTYTVLNPLATECLGCVYITPATHPLRHLSCEAEFSGAALPASQVATVSFWVRQSLLQEDCDRRLFSTLQTWFTQDWHFTQVLFLTSQQDTRQISLFMQASLVPCDELDAPGFSHRFIRFASSPAQ